MHESAGSGTEQSPVTRVLIERGIIEPHETAEIATNRALDGLVALDAELSGYYDETFAKAARTFVEEGVIVFGTPVLTNAGREGRVTAACTVLPVQVSEGRLRVDEFLASSQSALEKAIGTGYDLSDMQNPVEALTELNEALNVINDGLLKEKKRPVASMVTLRADHPRVADFVRAKRDVDFADWRVNISLFVTAELFEAASLGEDWPLRDQTGRVVDYINATELLADIADCAHYCGEPGILFKDRMERDNPTPYWPYVSTAPCAEVSMAVGEACQFSYVNLGQLTAEDESGQRYLDVSRFGEVVSVLTRLLDASVEQTIRNSGDLVLPLVKMKRRIGVGITGFADLLVKLDLPYDSAESVELAAQISELLDYHSKKASHVLAVERGPFPSYESSRFLDLDWLNRKSYARTGVVTEQDWNRLLYSIANFGIRHASTTSLPPTGTSSFLVGASKSLEPLFTLLGSDGEVLPHVYDYLVRRGEQGIAAIGCIALDPMSSIPAQLIDDFPTLKTARQIEPGAHLDVQAAFQAHLDEALAKTVNMPNHSTPDDVLALLYDVHQTGLKGVTVFRDGCLRERNQAKA